MSRARGLIAAATAAATAASAARLAYAAANQRPPGGTKTWSRTNHRGEPVTLLEGPALAAGAIVGVLAQAGLGPASSGAARSGAALAVAGAGAAAFGAYDDLAGSGDRRGFGGHLSALRHGEVTTGAVKLGGIGVTGIVSAALAGGSPGDVVLNAGLVAGGANLLNLFDLRPGRAIKVAVASGALLSAVGSRYGSRAGVAVGSRNGSRAGVAVGSRNGSRAGVAAPPAAGLALLPPLAAAIALLPEDLGERAMLGDCGANALGAMLGAVAAGLPRSARIALLAGIAGLTAASEKVSFTKVIQGTPPLRWLDMLGRRPPGGTGERAAAPQEGPGGWSPPRNRAAEGSPGGVRGASGEQGDGQSSGAEKRSPRERAVAPPGSAQSTGAATTLRSAEKTDPTPPDE